MANQILHETSTQIRFFVTGSFSPADAATNWTIGTPTDVVLTQSAVADGAGRQSTKVDLGTPWAPRYACFAAVDFTGETPTSGGTVDYYWAPSASGTQANGNIAGNSGADGVAPAGAVPSGITLAEFIRQCIYIGSLVVSDDATVQAGFAGYLDPPTQWGQLIVVNNSGDAFEADDVEAHAVLNPIIPEVQ